MSRIYRSSKKTIFRVCLVVEAVVFSSNYFFGSQGLYALRHIRTHKRLLEVECNALQNRVTSLSRERDQKVNSAFYKEKIAREQLQMAHPDEVIYHVGS
jgi:cell division protein FtsB